jgi:hypothetical protein
MRRITGIRWPGRPGHAIGMAWPAREFHLSQRERTQLAYDWGAYAR